MYVHTLTTSDAGVKNFSWHIQTMSRFIDAGENPLEVRNLVVQKKEKADIKASKMAWNELLQYQDGAVVSRTLIDKKVGTVTMFAFDEGQGLSEHTAPYDAMVMITDGEAEIRIAGEPTHLVKGETIIMPANKPHALRALSPFKMMLIMIRSEDNQPQLVQERM
jgi:quercetin dioxygenase-like cupin family protein